MSNPTTLASLFNGAAPGWAITGPERYVNGLWLEEGTTNELANSSFEANTSGWAANNSGNTIERTTDRSSDGAASLRIVGDGSVSQQGTSNSGSSPAATSGERWALSADVFAVGGETVRFVASERNSGGGLVLDTQGPTLTLASGWHRRNFAATLAGGGTVARVRFKFFTPTAQAIDLDLDACQLEKKPYATSYTAGTRAASSASISPAGILSPVKGSLPFWFRRKIDTGGIEPIVDCGDGTSGKDRLRVRINAADKLELSWQTNGGGERVIQSAVSLAVDTDYLIYVGWNGVHMELSVSTLGNPGAKATGTRDAPAGDWGTAPLTLKAE